MKLMFNNTEDSIHFRNTKFESEANIIALAQCVHSAQDILSCVIYFSLKQIGPNESRLNLQEVKKHIKYAPLKELITRLTGRAEYRFLSDFVNITKHRYLVSSPYTIEPASENGIKHGIKFSAFQYEGRTYKDKWAEEFFSEIELMMFDYIDIGHEINNAVAAL